MDLAKALAEAQERVVRASATLMSQYEGGEWEEWEAATSRVSELERHLAAAQNQEYAEPLDFPVRWDVGAPNPHLFDNGNQTFLTFCVHDQRPAGDERRFMLDDSEADSAELFALVEFKRCLSKRMGTPNSEVQSGHYLYGKGLQQYTAQVVRNSHWVAELEAINQVHPHFKPEEWSSLHHYIFWFHDETFECVAESFQVELFRESKAALMHRVVHRLLEN